MKSVVICEGSDDLWFIGYYLHKVAGWNVCKRIKDFWRYYSLPEYKGQEIKYFYKNKDCVAIWSVGGKDRYKDAVSTTVDKLTIDYPFDAVDSIIIVRDHDDAPVEDTLSLIDSWFHNKIAVENQTASTYTDTIEGVNVSISVVPVIIPCDESGAIETLLINCIKEKGQEESIIIEKANDYIDSILCIPLPKRKYLVHERERLKSRFSAVIAATNPTHSTALFGQMVMACPWEKSPSVAKYFDTILTAIASQL